MEHAEASRARAQIRPVKQRVEDELLSRAGVTGVDIAEKISNGEPTGRMAIVVYVKQKKAKRALAANELIPEEIDGIPTDVIEEDVVLHPALVKLDEAAPQVDAAKYPTLQGGIGIGPCRSVHLKPPEVPAEGNYVFVGTLGIMVRDRVSNAPMALTNFHVACINTGWAPGDVMAQPSLVDGGHCPADRFGTLTRGVLSEHVDGAVITLDSAKPWTCSIAEIGNIKGQAAAAVGMAVRKRGRTTGLTYGTVTSTDFSLNIDYGDGLGTRTLKQQIRVTVDSSHGPKFGDHGDSGSVVVTADNKVVGLHFAGNSSGTVGFANPIQAVLDELNVNLCKNITIVTNPVICDPMVTKPVFCLLTKPVTCEIVTKPAICSLVTTPAACPVITTAHCPVITAATCPPATLTCPIDPREGPLGAPAAGNGHADASGSGSGGGGEDAFWLGYYAALDAVAQQMAEDER